MIDLTADIAKANMLLSHIKNGAPKAINSALNRTIASVKTDIVHEITKTYDIKPKDARAAIRTGRSSLATLCATALGRGSPIPLINFNVTPNKPGYQAPGTVLRASVKRSGGKPIPGAFVAQMTTVGWGSGRRAAEHGEGHIGVFRRVGNSKEITELYGPSIPQMMKEENIQNDVMTRAETKFNQRLEHEIEYLLGKA